jgi:hypothetical protein
MLALATFFPCLLFLSCLFDFGAQGSAARRAGRGGGERKEGRKVGTGREGWGVGAVAVAAGGGIISIIMIIKLGLNIAAYEACITLFL